MSTDQKALLDKIATLPEERIAEVEDFVDFLRLKEEERQLRRAVTAASAPAFTAVWDNPDDDVYNAL